MTTLFRLDASLRTEGSVTRAIADSFVGAFEADFGEIDVVGRDIGSKPLPATAWAGAVFGPHVPEDQRTAEQREGIAIASELADELVAADAYVFAVPMYNYGVSQHFKAWADTLMAEPRFAPGTESPIAGRPAKLIVARGGGYGEGSPRFGWDHGTAWYRRVLQDIFLLDLDVIECELTLAEVTPAMEGLRGLAAENLASGHEAARKSGAALARALGGEPVRAAG